MAILAVIDVDDQGSLVVKNFKDALTDLGATVKKTDADLGRQTGAPKYTDALTQLTDQTRKAATEAVRNAQGFSTLSDQLKVGSTVTKLQADAFAQLAQQTQSNQKFTANYGQTMATLSGQIREGTTITAAHAERLKAVSDGYSGVSETAVQGTSALQGFSMAAAALAVILTTVVVSTSGLLKESGLLAGRIETLGIVMNVMGQNSTTTSLQMKGQSEAIKKLGITTQEARNSVLQFAQANLDVADASKVARVAQDLAVVAGENSSQTFQRLTTAIQVQQPLLLRQVGIVTGLQQIYGEYAASVGKTVKQLDEAEKKQAFVNKILEEGAKVTGAYEGAMTSAYKQIGSFARYVEEAKVKLGEALQPAMLAGVEIATVFLKTWTALPPAVQAFVTSLAVASAALAAFGAALTAAKLLGLITLFTELAGRVVLLTEAVSAGTGVWAAVVALFGGPWMLALTALAVTLAAVSAAYVYFTGVARAHTEETRKNAEAAMGSIIVLRNQQEAVQKTSERIQTLSTDLTKLETAHQQTSETERRAIAIKGELAQANDTLRTQAVAAIALAPGVSSAITGETVNVQALNVALQDQIRLKLELINRGKAQVESELRTAEAQVTAMELYDRQMNQQVRSLKQLQTQTSDASVQRSLTIQVAALNERIQENAAAWGVVRANVTKLTAEYNAYRRETEPDFKLQEDLEQKAKAFEDLQQKLKESGGTIEQALKLVKKTEQELLDPKMSVRLVQEALDSAKTAWDKHIADIEKKNAHLAAILESYRQKLLGEDPELLGKLRTLNTALTGVEVGSEKYVAILMAGEGELKKWADLTEAQKKNFDQLGTATQALAAISLDKTFSKYVEKAREVTQAFQELADSGVRKFGDDIIKFTEQANDKRLASEDAFVQDMIALDRDLYERTTLGKLTEVDQKIYQNNRYYADQQHQLQRQIALLDVEKAEELRAIHERATAADVELDEAKRRALIRFRVDVDTETAKAKAIEAINLLKDKTEEQRKSAIEFSAKALEADLDTITTKGQAEIAKLTAQAMLDYQTRQGLRDRERAGYIQHLAALASANAETNDQIRRQNSLVTQEAIRFWGDTAQAATQNLATIVLRTQSWKDALVNIFRSLRNSVLGILDDIVGRWTQGLAKVMTGMGSGKGGFLSQVSQAAGFTKGLFSSGVGAVTSNVGAMAVGGAWPSATVAGASTGTTAAAAGGGLSLSAGTIAAVGGVVGAAVLAGFAIYKLRENATKKDRTSFLSEKGFPDLAALREFMVQTGKVDQANELFNRAANVIGKHDNEANKVWIQDVQKALNQIEASKAFDDLAAAQGGADRLRVAMQLVGHSFEALKMGVDAGDVKGVTDEVALLNKALAEQKTRLDGLGVAAAGLAQQATGFQQGLERTFGDILKAFSAQDTEAFRGRLDAAKAGGFGGTDAQFLQSKGAQGDLTPETLAKIAAATERAQAEFSRMGVTATAVFAGILADTGDLVQALNAVSPTLDILIQAQTDLGLVSSGAFDQLLRFREVVTANQDVANSLSGINQILRGLTEAGQLTQATFDALGGSAVANFQALQDRGVDANAALMLMQPTLQALYEAQKQFGFATDDATQKLIQMGIEQGVVGDNIQDVNHQILDVLLAIGDALGATLPEAYRKTKKAAQEAADASKGSTSDLEQAQKDVAAATDVWKEKTEAVNRAIQDVDNAKALGDTQDATDLAEAAMARLRDRTREAQEALESLGRASDILRGIEAAAGGAAEGHSPTGMRQLVQRTRESIALFHQLREAAAMDLRAIEHNAGRTGLAIPLEARPQARVIRDNAPASAAPITLIVQHSPTTTVQVSSLDGADAETVWRTKLAPMLLSQSDRNHEQFAAKLEKTLSKQRR